MSATRTVRHQSVQATLATLITYGGSGSRKRKALWDQYVVELMNHGDRPLAVASATLLDSKGTPYAAGSDPWVLEKQSKKLEQPYRDRGETFLRAAGPGVRIVAVGPAAGSAAGAALVFAPGASNVVNSPLGLRGKPRFRAAKRAGTGSTPNKITVLKKVDVPNFMDAASNLILIRPAVGDTESAGQPPLLAGSSPQPRSSRRRAIAAPPCGAARLYLTYNQLLKILLSNISIYVSARDFRAVGCASLDRSRQPGGHFFYAFCALSI